MPPFMTAMRPQGLYDPWYEHDSCGVGFVVNIKGERSHTLMRQALEVLANVEHRGAVGCDPDTGDGAGILMQIPHDFFLEESIEKAFPLPEPGQYAVGMLFLPRESLERHRCERLAEQIIAEHGFTFLGWRTVPTNNSMLGEGARYLEPVVRQIFVRRPKDVVNDLDFERRLYVCRRHLDNRVKAMGPLLEETFYVCSFSARILIYKGMLTPRQLPEYYLDLRDPEIKTALALVHSRFSTNTFPNWMRAHPNRYIAHNGEINTLRGNVNWMHARQALLASRLFGSEWAKILPVIDENGSDSAMFDNCLEFLHLSGRSLPHAVMMMIPEPWSGHRQMSDEKKAFYEYHACLMEPWDGPAAIAFTDGVRIGAVLDRNGLRPSRYYITKDDLVILASEAGVLPIPDDRIVMKGRLQPGKHVPGRYGKRADRSRRRDQGRDRQRPPVPPVARREPGAPGGSAGQRSAAVTGTGDVAAAAAGVRLYLRGSARGSGADGAQTASSRSAPWATTRPWPCCRSSRSFSTTISSSSSPRSPTRRSTASARRSSPPPRPPSGPSANAEPSRSAVVPADPAGDADPRQ